MTSASKDSKQSVEIKLNQYISSRKKEGHKVSIKKPIYFTSVPRCVVSIDGEDFRMYYRKKTGLWHKA